VSFLLRALNFGDRAKDHEMGETHEFTAKCTDWGFPKFLSHERLANERGFVIDNKIIVEVGQPSPSPPPA
jgi:hypothetical protein